MKLKSTLLLYTLNIILFATSCGQKTPKHTAKEASQNIEIEILSVLKSGNTSNNYNLTFGVKGDTSKKLTMEIGNWEAQTLGITLEKLHPTAPLPLDLLEDAINKFGYNVQQVVIDSLVNEIYTAKIVCNNNIKTVSLKARVADAATISAKFKVPIYIDRKLIFSH